LTKGRNPEVFLHRQRPADDWTQTVTVFCTVRLIDYRLK
jgi:hypothetical protein